jgi:hypothetical protein
VPRITRRRRAPGARKRTTETVCGHHRPGPGAGHRPRAGRTGPQAPDDREQRAPGPRRHLHARRTPAAHRSRPGRPRRAARHRARRPPQDRPGQHRSRPPSPPRPDQRPRAPPHPTINQTSREHSGALAMGAAHQGKQSSVAPPAHGLDAAPILRLTDGDSLISVGRMRALRGGVAVPRSRPRTDAAVDGPAKVIARLVQV